MPIEFSCPECGKHLVVSDESAGRQGKCKACGHPLRVPGSASDGVNELDEISMLDSWHVGPTQRHVPWKLIGGLGGGIVLALVAIAALISVRPRPAAPDPGPRTPPPPAVRPEPARAAVAVAEPDEAEVPDVLPVREATVPEPEVRPETVEAVRRVPPGVLTGEAADLVKQVLETWIADSLAIKGVGARTVRRGTRFKVEVNGHSYAGRLRRSFSIKALRPGEMEIGEIHATTVADWPVGEDLVLPDNSQIVYDNGTCELLDLDALEAEARKRQAYLDEALVKIDRAIKSEQWVVAAQLLHEARQVFPQARELAGRAARIEKGKTQATVMIINRSRQEVSIVLERTGHQPIRVILTRNEITKIQLPKGTYTASYATAGATMQEEVEVTGPETWAIRAGDRMRPGMPGQIYLRREIEAARPRGMGR